MTRPSFFRRLQYLLLPAAAFGSLFFCIPTQTRILAQTSNCGVGASVRVEMIDNAVGTVTAIGTEPPHVGWYRVVYEWNVRSGNPQGEWYNPKYREIRAAGTNAKCGAANSAGKPVASPTSKARPSVQGAGDPFAIPDGCPMNEPPGKATKTSPPSPQLFKRVIYDSMAAKVNEGSISAPKRIGLTFIEFEMGRAYKNTLSARRIGDRRLHDGAPVRAMIYPVKTKYLRCELYDREINGYVRQTNYACFKNRFGDWDCPVDSVTKTLERRSFPTR